MENKNAEIKDLKGYRGKLILLWVGLIAAVLVVAVVFLLALGKKFEIEIIGLGLSVEAAIIGGVYSCISNFKTRNEAHRDKQEQEKREDKLRAEQQAFTKQLEDQQQAFEEKWNQKRINADLKAKARIEWIQRVREATSIFYSSCYDLLKSTFISNDSVDDDHVKKLLMNATEMGSILILYFGPEKNAEHEYELDSQESNEGKNDKIVNLIESILKDNEQVKNDFIHTKYEVNRLKNERKYLFPIIPTKIEEITDPEEDMPDTQCVLDEESDEYKVWVEINNNIDKILKEYSERSNNRSANLKQLIDAIRIYLKIEWDRAKNNEDENRNGEQL